ncbi:MAG: hypothetical protein AAF492_02935 [Verrucomicrobiota bacterium]
MIYLSRRLLSSLVGSGMAGEAPVVSNSVAELDEDECIANTDPLAPPSLTLPTSTGRTNIVGTGHPVSIQNTNQQRRAFDRIKVELP